jgi:hypothetical protein
MGLSDSIVGDIGEQLAELGTHVVKQTGKATASIVKGVVTAGKSDSSAEGISGSTSSVQQSGSSDIKNKRMSSTAMDPATQQKLAIIRQNLRAMMTPKPAPPEQSKYISGKPGGSIDEQKKMQEKIIKENKKMSELSISAKAGQGSGEKHRGSAG